MSAFEGCMRRAGLLANPLRSTGLFELAVFCVNGSGLRAGQVRFDAS
jgi:hypothetical protein